METTKRALLTEWGNYIFKAAVAGVLVRGGVTIRDMVTISGPRAGAIHLNAGIDTGRLLEVFRKNDYAMTAQFITWDFPGKPIAFMSGRYLRLEAGWEKQMAESDITLASLSQNPKNGGRWVAGKNEGGQTIILSVDDDTPSWLVSGVTGSGKSEAMRTAAAQLSQDPNNRVILLDPKVGEGLGPVQHLPRQIAPMAIDGPTIRKALSWIAAEMMRRYKIKLRNGNELPPEIPRLIVFLDEIQIVTGLDGDEDIIRLVHKIASEGRAARIHLIVGTQKPSAKAFSHDAIKTNLVGRLALLVNGYKDSEIAVGSNTPRADRLQGKGDAYAIVPSTVQRTQLAYIPREDMSRYTRNTRFTFSEWPDVSPETVGEALNTEMTDSRQKTKFNGTEIATSLTLATETPPAGRPALQRQIKKDTGKQPGSGRAAALLSLGRETLAALQGKGFKLAKDT